MRILTCLSVAAILAMPLQAMAFTWGCGDWGGKVVSAAEGGLSKAEAASLLPRYEDLGKALRARAHGKDAPCVAKTLRAWDNIGAQLRGAPAKQGQITKAMNRLQSTANGCATLN